MMDNYEHMHGEVVYISENIPGPAPSCHSTEYETLIDNYNSQITCHCSCEFCNLPSCECFVKSRGQNYVKNQKGIMLLNFSKLCDEVSNPVFECNDICLCKESCFNRVVQKGPVKGLVIKEGKELEKEKGLGLWSSKFINKGAFICEYAGELLTKSQAMARQKRNTECGKMNYIFCLNEYSKGTCTQTIVDPAQFGNIGRYINHSCEPNCHIIPVRVDCPIPKLAIFAKTDIPADTEITFNYGTHNLKLNNQSENLKLKSCFCGSAQCKRWLPFETY